MSDIRIGACNWADFAEWYPQGLKATARLGYYAQHFSVVEIDSTFYHLMPRRNFAGWAEKTPDTFVFDVKAYRTLTRHGASYEPGTIHEDADPRYDPAEDDFQKFAYQIEPLREAGKLRAVLFQFPPWFKRTEANLEHIDVCREYLADHLIAVEFRHRSWLEPAVAEETFAFLRERDIVYTAVDEPQIGSGSVPPLARVTNPALSIVRFHGRNAESWYARGTASSRDRFDYLYSHEELADWVPTIEDLAGQAREVHVLMNNNAHSHAITNAQDMQRLLKDDQAMKETR